MTRTSFTPLIQKLPENRWLLYCSTNYLLCELGSLLFLFFSIILSQLQTPMRQIFFSFGTVEWLSMGSSAFFLSFTIIVDSTWKMGFPSKASSQGQSHLSSYIQGLSGERSEGSLASKYGLILHESWMATLDIIYLTDALHRVVNFFCYFCWIGTLGKRTTNNYILSQMLWQIKLKPKRRKGKHNINLQGKCNSIKEKKSHFVLLIFLIYLFL